ncbi:uncharacterized protein LOC117794468 [Drosophila innubila]|uniref:uncharacterized protein LOC117794468 n=1 Tax=Drosophila innubila TaxID=198719 RepID=UPI00148CBA72|nr:uncharacterized protein LOC117794468 [Drosophila innubila]
MRTQMILLDYKQFKAARFIQKNFRGWQVRNLMNKKQRAAIVIQRKLRRFIARRHLEIVAQEKAQESILVLFDSSSVKIQALFRGYWSRKHLHNFIFLESIQLNAIEDVLYCMARKLHHMKRTAKLPGLLSFSERKCLSKVEELLSTMSYRMYNSKVAKKSMVIKANIQNNKVEYKKSEMCTWIPYKGFYCDPSPNWDIPIKVYEHNEQEFADSFVKADRIFKHQKTLSEAPRLDKGPPKVISVKQKEFCERMMWKIKKWSVFKEENLDTSESLMDASMSEFLDIIKGYLETCNYLENCYCKSDPKRSCPLT